jgi:predicted acylesterase/phospholipase RssA
MCIVSDAWTNSYSFVCATSKETGETVCLTSYHTAHGSSDQFNSMTIWEACRATSFFDPIAVGRFSEDFVDGATGANNPVREMWDQAQLVWGPEPLKGEVKCLVSIGTGVPSLKMLAAEQTAEYYRFNVVEKIGLEEAKTVKAVAAATRRYISSEEMQRPMQACAGAISR